MKFNLKPKYCLGSMMIVLVAFSSCSKKSETSNDPNNSEPAAPTIESIQPNQAYAGDTVIVNGTNYSTVLSENTVKFNGNGATLIAATTTQLKVKVPQGTTGSISVKVKNSSDVVSSGIFTYLSPVAISSFSPTSATAGKTVKITGTNFSTSLTGNIVSFNGTRAIVTAATPTQLMVTVPQGASSGPITVSVNNHSATSQPFSVTIQPLSNWEEIPTTTPTGDLVIAASVGSVMIYTNINLDDLNFTSNLYKFSNGIISNIYGSSTHVIGNVFSLTSSSNAIYILSDQGIFRSEDGTTWNTITPAFGSGQFYTGLTTKGNELTVYNGNKAYTSTDNGTTWGSQTFNNPNAITSNGYSTVYSGEAANNYYYSIPYVNAGNVAITRSTDGINWTTTKGIQGGYAYSAGYHDVLAASGDNVFCVYSTTVTNNTSLKRLYKSTDHGDTWAQVSDEKVNSVKAFDNYVIYGYDSLNVSTDNGNTFTKYTIPAGYIIGGIQKVGTDIYIFCSNGNTHKIFKSSL